MIWLLLHIWLDIRPGTNIKVWKEVWRRTRFWWGKKVYEVKRLLIFLVLSSHRITFFLFNPSLRRSWWCSSTGIFQLPSKRPGDNIYCFGPLDSVILALWALWPCDLPPSWVSNAHWAYNAHGHILDGCVCALHGVKKDTEGGRKKASLGVGCYMHKDVNHIVDADHNDHNWMRRHTNLRQFLWEQRHFYPRQRKKSWLTFA